MIKVLHIEPTNACNAACPQCAREYDLTFDKNIIHHLRIDQILEHINEYKIKNLNKMFMCGDYGDPAAGKHTLEIYDFFREINPNITLGMNTNGGLRTTDWWMNLGRILTNQKDYVIFSIDGLEDTNHIYRVNVNFKTVIKNCEAFISAGGNAHWDMLVFEHNQHQVEMAKNLAKSMGFKWFRAKVSKRFEKHPVSFLKPPKNYKFQKITGNIECLALKEKSLYISASGKLHPCCWLGYNKDGVEYKDFHLIQDSWNTSDPNMICKNTCSSIHGKNNFTTQWHIEEELC
jgi:MoaA/NifB/PqqE/SkfB family radical SAM enzyme